MEQVPAALSIDVTPVPLMTEQALEAPAEYEIEPSELDDGLVVALTVALLPYLSEETADPEIVRVARLTVNMPVA